MTKKIIASENASGADNQQVTDLLRRKQITPDYICGLVDGEGCFYILSTNRIACEFKISQKKREILNEIKKFFGCGYVKSNSDKGKTFVYIVKDIRSLDEIIKPFFTKHRLFVKYKQFDKFAQAVDLIKRKLHLSKNGQAAINRIKLGTSETVC